MLEFPLSRALGLVAVGMITAMSAFSAAPGLETVTVKAAATASRHVADGVVEAVRTASIGAQVQGQVTSLRVKAGDRVRAGDVLLNIDQRLAEKQASASRAEVAAAEARLAAAQADLGRQRRLFEREYISKAAMDRAEADFKTARAQANAQLAAAEASNVSTGLFTLHAPFSGVVAQVSVERGDMVMPGRALFTLYDPAALRVSVRVPQELMGVLANGPGWLEPAAGTPADKPIELTRRSVLPVADPATHTVEIRLELPPQASSSWLPGQFARVSLPLAGAVAAERFSLPLRAVVRRGELTAVYVVDDKGSARLRQVRLGPVQGDRVEIAAGLENGERVALDPLVAARAR